VNATISLLKELWERRLLVALSALLATVVAVVVVYDVGLAPPSIAKRDRVEAQGSIEILVDSARSPIADVGRNLEPLTARAGVFARYIAGGKVIARISKQTGIPVRQIQVAGPAPLPGEAPGAEEAPAQQLPYGIAIVQRDALPILNVVTRAPTVEEARELAAAAPAAVSGIVTAIQLEERIPPSKRVTFRVLGPAQANPVTEALGAKVALLIFSFVFGLLILLILGIPRLIDAWWAADGHPDEPQLHPQLRVASIAKADEGAERAQLEMPAAPHPGDG
jgi:hypothetical protein